MNANNLSTYISKSKKTRSKSILLAVVFAVVSCLLLILISHNNDKVLAQSNAPVVTLTATQKFKGLPTLTSSPLNNDALNALRIVDLDIRLASGYKIEYTTRDPNTVKVRGVSTRSACSNLNNSNADNNTSFDTLGTETAFTGLTPVDEDNVDEYDRDLTAIPDAANDKYLCFEVPYRKKGAASVKYAYLSSAAKIDSNAPKVKSDVAISPKMTYRAGDKIVISVPFDKVVYVTATRTNPVSTNLPKIDIDNDDDGDEANYSAHTTAGSSGTTLTFTYTVDFADNGANDGDTVLQDKNKLCNWSKRRLYN